MLICTSIAVAIIVLMIEWRDIPFDKDYSTKDYKAFSDTC